MKLLLGFAVGIALGLVYAPASGEETRHKLFGAVKDWIERPEQKVHDVAGDLGSKWGREAAEAAVDKVLHRGEEKSA